MKRTAYIHHHWLLSTLISLSEDFATNQQLVEHTSSRCGNVLLSCHPVLLQLLFRVRCIHLLAYDVQVPSQEDSFSSLHEIAHPGIERIEEADSKFIPSLVSVCRTIDTDEDESRKFENDTTTFGIEGRNIEGTFGEL